MDKIMMDSYNQQMDMYNQQVAEWEKEYPVNNPKGMIKSWLNSFLDVSKDVDFKAQLAEDKNGRKLFVNQDYERKNSTWKLCYRSGKETVESARKFAQNWLSELK
jgi:predicted SAM-dependent methyltransferase